MGGQEDGSGDLGSISSAGQSVLTRLFGCLVLWQIEFRSRMDHFLARPFFCPTVLLPDRFIARPFYCPTVFLPPLSAKILTTATCGACDVDREEFPLQAMIGEPLPPMPF